MFMRKPTESKSNLDNGVQFEYEVDRCDRLNIRYGPGYAYDVIKSVPKGTKLVAATSLHTVDEWPPVFIKHEPDVVGYCMGDFLKRLTKVE